MPQSMISRTIVRIAVLLEVQVFAMRGIECQKSIRNLISFLPRILPGLNPSFSGWEGGVVDLTG